MDWFTAIEQIGQDLIMAADRATDRASATIDRTISSVVQDAAGKLDQVIDQTAMTLDRSLVAAVQEVAGRIDQTIDQTTDQTLRRSDSPLSKNN